LVLYLAPLRGITDSTFRSVYATHFKGFDCAVAPFISSVRGAAVKLSHVKDVMPENNRALPIVPQIIGNNPLEFVVLARQLFDMGYAAVNWNIGCPFPQVTKKKRGAGLLAYPEKIESFLEHVVPRIPNRLSIKTRIGLGNKEEMAGFLPVFNRFPLVEIIVHPRTARQMYTGTVDLDGFNLFLNSCVHPLVFNGDIVSTEFFSKVSSLFPTVSRWMIGRGAIADPTLPESIWGGKPDASARLGRIKRFHDELAAAYMDCMKNRGNILDKLKGVWFYLAQSLPDGKRALKRIQKTRNWERYREIVEEVMV